MNNKLIYTRDYFPEICVKTLDTSLEEALPIAISSPFYSYSYRSCEVKSVSSVLLVPKGENCP